MPRLAFALFVFASSCTPAATPAPPGTPTDAPRPVADHLAWLVGAWAATTPQGEVVERWHRADDGALVGRSETRSGDEVVFFEALRIEFDADGRATYLASPMGRTPPTPFRETLPRQPDRLVVENPDHDFPQRITYTRTGDALRAEIAGGGREAAWEYQRAR